MYLYYLYAVFVDLFIPAEPPEIHVGQKDFTVLQNRTIVLPCQASGRPKPKIRWEKAGQEITAATNHRLAQGSRVHYITLQTGGLAIPHTRLLDVLILFFLMFYSVKCVLMMTLGLDHIMLHRS